MTQLNTEQIATTNEAADFFKRLEAVSKTDTTELEKLGASVRRNGLGAVTSVKLRKSPNVGLAHVKTLTKIQSLDLSMTKVTHAGLVHIKG